MQQTDQKHEQFTGVVENAVEEAGTFWIRTDSGETLFSHRNYTRKRELPEKGARVAGSIKRVQDVNSQDGARNVEVCNG
jgi:hypothetical protein